MKARWNQLATWVDARSLRERVLIFGAVAFVLIELINVLLLNPLLAQQRKISDEIVQKQEQIKSQHAQIQEWIEASKNDKNSPLRMQISQAYQQIAGGEAYLHSLRDRLVQPDQMAGLLQQILQKNGRLELVAMNTQPAQPLLSPSSPAADTANPSSTESTKDVGQQVYAHRVTLTVRGSYAELLRYLQALEQMPYQMFWGEASMNATQYPAVDLTLTLFTLSLDKTWLKV